MAWFKRIFALVWAFWGCFSFIVVVFVFTPIYAIILGIFGKKYSIKCVWVNVHYLCPLLLNLWLIRLKVYNRENVDKKGTYVFVANHLSQVDIIASGAAMSLPIRFLAKAEIKKIPVFGYMTKMLAIMVDRKNKESREKSVHYMVEELHRGISIFLYPEGTRNRTEQPLKEFKDGAFRVAVMAQVPIVIQTIVGSKKVNNPEGIQLLPGTIQIYFSKPIETKGLYIEDVPLLIEKAKTEMMSHLSAV